MDAGLRIDIPDTCANLIDCKTQTAGILCLILNCFLPGIGSIIAGVVSTRLFRTRAKQLARALFLPHFSCFSMHRITSLHSSSPRRTCNANCRYRSF